MFVKTIYLYLSIFMIKSVICIEDNIASNLDSDVNSDINLRQTNCSFNDLKCIISRNRLFSNASQIFIQTISETKNLTFERNCTFGQSYLDIRRHQCIDCTHNCPVNSKVDQKCNETHDTQCVCNSGYFMASDFTCKQCSTCDPGWGIWRSCRGARNTVCRKCPPGTFSGVQTGTLGCILCTKCNSDEVMLEECSGVHDSICIDKRKLKYSLNAIKDDDFIENTGNSLYIYFGLLIAIVLVLFVYIIFQLRFKTIVKTESNFNSQQTFKYPVNYHNNYNKEVHSQRQRQYNYIPVIKTNKTISNYNKYSNEKTNKCLIDKRYNELNTFSRRAFEKNLNKESQSWKSLAKQLGYSDESILMFESMGRQRMNCVQYFLNEWSKCENSTINLLLKALHKIGRIDCILIIDPSLRVSPY